MRKRRGIGQGSAGVRGAGAGLMLALRRVLGVAMVVVLGMAGGGCEGSRSSTGVVFSEVAVGRREHRYSVYVPREYGADPRCERHAGNVGKGWPMVVFLNGSGECGEDGQRQLTQGLLPAVMNKPEDWPFVIVFPQKPERDSEWPDHAALVLGVVEASVKRYEIDQERVYLTGLSQGGHGTWMIGAMHAELFAAIAPVCGYGPHGIDQTGLSELGAKLQAMPVWAFHGELDDVVPAEESKMLVRAIEQARGEGACVDEKGERAARGVDERLKLTIYGDLQHNAWDRAYRDSGLGAWFLAHRRGR